MLAFNAHVDTLMWTWVGPMSQMDCAAHAGADCGNAADLLLDRHEWQLLDRAEFLRRTVDHLQSGVAQMPAAGDLHI